MRNINYLIKLSFVLYLFFTSKVLLLNEFLLSSQYEKDYTDTRRTTFWEKYICRTFSIEEEKFLSRHNIYNKVCVVDCITLWCTNFFFDANQNNPKEPVIDEALDAIKKEFDQFTAQDATFIFVTNEIGSGGVSDNVVQRRFTDMEGWMNQYVASKADEVVLMVSGIPVKIK